VEVAENISEERPGRFDRRIEEAGGVGAWNNSVKLQFSYNFGNYSSKTSNYAGKYGGGGEI
jgi:hypothetical protein